MVAPPEPKTEEKYTTEDKRDHELVRRWRVVIQDIEIVNQTSTIINPFVKFIIGGDFYVSSFNHTLHSTRTLFLAAFTDRHKKDEVEGYLPAAWDQGHHSND
jgi:hypothetical protein